MKAWELLCIVSLSVVVGRFSGPRIALNRSFKTLHPKLVSGIVSYMDQTMAPVLTVLMPVSVLATVPILIDSYSTNSFLFGLNTASLILNLLSIVFVVVFEIPLVHEITGWTASSVPEDWQRRRDRWQMVHLLRVLFSFASLLSLVVAIPLVWI
jgi:hypothetical protein